MPTKGFSIKPLKVRLLAGEQTATEKGNGDYSPKFYVSLEHHRYWPWLMDPHWRLPLLVHDGVQASFTKPDFIFPREGLKMQQGYNIGSVVIVIRMSGAATQNHLVQLLIHGSDPRVVFVVYSF